MTVFAINVRNTLPFYGLPWLHPSACHRPFHRALLRGWRRAGDVTNGPTSHPSLFNLLIGFPFHERCLGKPYAITIENFTFVGKIQAGDIYIFHVDVLPYIHFCPVGYRENPEMFAHIFFAVEYIPQLGALVFGIPLSEFITV